VQLPPDGKVGEIKRVRKVGGRSRSLQRGGRRVGSDKQERVDGVLTPFSKTGEYSYPIMGWGPSDQR